MQDNWSNQNSYYTNKDVIKYFNENACIPIKENLVRNHMKRSLNQSYNKASSRPSQINSEKHKIMKMAFIMEFSNLSAPDKLLISLDEVNFSYLTQYNRTWLHKGWSSYVKNICFKGSRSWIGAITSRADLLFLWLESTNKSPNFVNFLKELKIWIQLDQNIKMTNAILIHDNCHVHKCKKTLNGFKRIRSNNSISSCFSTRVCSYRIVV